MSSTFGAPVVESTPLPAVVVPSEAKSLENYVEEYFKDTPVMIKVAYCESRFRHYEKNGTIHRGDVNPDDVGVMQINGFYHKKRAEKLGHDIYTLKGNLDYAKYLFEKEGTTPWLSSSPCWGKENHVARK